MESKRNRPKYVFSLMSNQAESTFPVKLCFWNINGVRNKFLSESVMSLIRDTEILVIVETHFNVRSKLDVCLRYAESRERRRSHYNSRLYQSN